MLSVGEARRRQIIEMYHGELIRNLRNAMHPALLGSGTALIQALVRQGVRKYEDDEPTHIYVSNLVSNILAICENAVI